MTIVMKFCNYFPSSTDQLALRYSVCMQDEEQHSNLLLEPLTLWLDAARWAAAARGSWVATSAQRPNASARHSRQTTGYRTCVARHSLPPSTRLINAHKALSQPLRQSEFFSWRLVRTALSILHLIFFVFEVYTCILHTDHLSDTFFKTYQR